MYVHVHRYASVRALAPLDAAAIARRPARRQPGKLQARPYFVLSCCFSTRRKEMSEQTRHATPNLLISIHILWLLISSLLHSLSTRLPSPSPHFASPRSHYLSFSLFFYLLSSPARSPFLQFFSLPLLNSRCTLCLLLLLLLFSVPFCRLLPPLLLSSALFFPLLFICLLIFSLNSIPRRRKNPRDFFSSELLLPVVGFFLCRNLRRSQRHPICLQVVFFFMRFRFLFLFMFRHHGISSKIRVATTAR